MSTPERRSYDARRRRERAEAEKRATRTRVVEAAHALFVERGYRATTITDIARAAGVAVQSVYNVAASKSELLHLAVDLAVAGDDDPVRMTERADIERIAATADPEQQLAQIAALITTIQTRSATIQSAYREAAAVDASVADRLAADQRRRHETFSAVVAMLPAERLRVPLADAVDTVWAVGSHEVFMLTRTSLEWDEDRFRAWLARTLIDALLVPTP
ncbi:MAG: TetR/AcrR family transcriptional regulator [Candidatus Nanopelagicales bacterium]|jgi:AcrR family transcriptional regulator